jgi:putative peptide zinc metalloprotease protein
LGHGYIAKYFGCRVSAIGIAFLVFFPFLYTDTTDAWRLRNHRERLIINFAGILTELHLALIATFLWAILPDGGLKSVTFFIATTSWISSLAINVSPFMRFDGYYVFADWLKAENLQPRSFALARWQLREILFGLNYSPPEELNPSRRWTFILYAWLTWIYRFFLFLGIAFLVYHLAFKVLGILLFVIEIYWFILKPIINEIKYWSSLKSEIKLNKETKRLYIILTILILGLLLPWKSSLKLPAVYVSEQYSKIYSPYPAQIKEIFVNKDEIVTKDQELIKLYSPELDLNISSIRRKIQLTKTKIKGLSRSAGNLDQYMTLQQRLIALQAELDGLNKIQSKFLIKSPIDGRIKNFANLSINQWVSNLDELMGIVKYGTGSVVGFVKESQIDRFKLKEHAVFIPFDGQHSKVKLISQNLDLSAVSILPYPALSSNYGGPIATRAFVSGEYKNRPEVAHYQATFKLIKKVSSIELQLPGYVHVDGYRYSPFFRFLKNVFSLLIRESSI